MLQSLTSYPLWTIQKLAQELGQTHSFPHPFFLTFTVFRAYQGPRENQHSPTLKEDTVL